MDSIHQLYLDDARNMEAIKDKSIDLVVTSPPYPMIEMWDDTFKSLNPDIEEALTKGDGNRAFELMHTVLQSVWEEVQRVLVPGGIACINIGDATRTLNDLFQLHPNHATIVSIFRQLGFTQLPTILWRKPTNSPNKFMGSGMLPPGAYVTLEHEYILIFRKGNRRAFPDKSAAQKRRESAYFWEERNIWFSDVWLNLIGAQQMLTGNSNRNRSGAFPLELPSRLINMFSTVGDTILDPFLGTGTTMLAAMCTGRNSLGYECDHGLLSTILEKIAAVPALAAQILEDRINAHLDFVETRTATKGDLKYRSRHYGFPVMTRQEIELQFARVQNLQFQSNNRFAVRYQTAPAEPTVSGAVQAPALKGTTKITSGRGRQLKIF
jgi:DNA modification methylase